MLKKFLVVGAVAGMFVACGDSDSSQSPEPATPDVTGLSSSIEAATESSSSQEGTTTTSSSSQESTATESSSSEEATAQEPQIPVLDKLPFDTTGITPQVLTYKIEPDFYTLEEREKFGPYLGYRIVTEEWAEAVCTVMHAYESGKIFADLMGGLEESNCVLVVREDSLMFSNISNCQVPIWGSCRNAEAYSKKIVVGDGVFYYGESEKQLQLAQLTDSTITIWLTMNPSYVVPDSVKATRTWRKSDFEGDTLVKFVGESILPDYVDTIFIEKYNVTITDWGATWIFENETCSSQGFVKDTTKTSREQCKDWESYRNSSVDCIARNMKTPEGVYPRLCRPTKIEHSSVWCILDGDYVPSEE